MAWLCTTIAGSMPILFASCSAAPSALGPAGTGSVNDVCTMPSPVVSPYGRTTFIGRGSDTGHLPRALQQLQRRVVGTLGQPRSEEHTSELQSRQYLVCRLLLEKKNSRRMLS